MFPRARRMLLCTRLQRWPLPVILLVTASAGRPSLPKVLPGHMPHSLTHQHGDMKAQRSPAKLQDNPEGILAPELHGSPADVFIRTLPRSTSSVWSCFLSLPSAGLILKVPLEKITCSSSPQSPFPQGNQPETKESVLGTRKGRKPFVF